MKSWRKLSPASVLGLLSISLVALVATPAAAAYSTSARESWSANNTVYAIAVHGNTVYIGGHFTGLSNVYTGDFAARSHIAAFDATTGALITTFDPAIDADVRAIQVSADGSTIYVGGTFANVNGTVRTRVAALDTAGALVPGWDVSASGMVRDLAMVGSDLFLAGNFSTVNSVSRPGLAKVNAATGQVSSWKVPTGGGKPRSIVPSPNGTDLIVAGSFTSLEGQSRVFLGSATLATGDVTAWNPPPDCLNCDVFDVVAAGDAVFGAVGGGGGRAAKWSATTGALTWSVHTDGNAQAVAVTDGTLYVGGHFGPTFAGEPRGQLAAVDAGTGALLPWAPNLGTTYFPGVWAIDAGPDFLRVGGGFRSVNGILQARFAEFPFV